MMRELRAFGSGVMFLTRIPVPRAVGHSDAQLAASTAYFPVVGALVGAIGGVVLLLAARWWTPFIAATAAVATTIWVTGAFHEDAWADACDGFGGGWDTEQVLTIMKDSRVGAYGAIGVALMLAARIAAVSALVGRDPWTAARVLLAAHVLARWSSLPLIRALPYLSTQGNSKPVAAGVTIPRLAVGTALAALLSLSVLAPLGARVVGIAWGVGGVTTIVGARYLRRRIGGITGDALGAVNQATEVAICLAMAMRGVIA
ncbi:MAG: adenosylcobinamide-GDP ribazoletransferase [Gemmatimonadaceae bacterium]|jgi:adenosylcobinamide-GDP ribazoletransferase|nr:adenosylcobinamide-GDP ribazoletransferase [Gemmatimonadaceae bacterium]